MKPFPINFPDAIKILDYVFVSDWAHRIDLDTLDMEDTNLCIIGQLGKPVGVTYESFMKNVFGITDRSDRRYNSGIFAKNTMEWKRIIGELRKDVPHSSQTKKSDETPKEVLIFRDKRRKLVSLNELQPGDVIVQIFD